MGHDDITAGHHRASILLSIDKFDGLNLILGNLSCQHLPVLSQTQIPSP